MSDPETALADIRQESDPSRKNMRVAELVCRAFRVGSELRTILVDFRKEEEPLP